MNKFKKSKVVGITVASLMAVASATVGFSAWIAAGKTGIDTADVTVNVEDVKDQRIALKNPTITYAANGGIFFDADQTGLPEGSTTPLMPSGAKPNLTFTVKFNCKVGNDVSAFNGISAWIELKGNTLDPNRYANSISKEDKTTYFIAPENISFGEDSKKSLFEKGKVTLEEGDNELSFTCTFRWGGFFENKNPTLSATNDNVDSYIAALKELKEKKPTTFVVHLIAD